jgi:hypothetical protein
MAEPSSPEPVETVRDGYLEAQPRSQQDVEEARNQEELLSSSGRTPSDRSLTGQTHPVDSDEEGSSGS